MHLRRNFARLDLAAAAPEDVRVVDRNPALLEVRIDRGLVRKHAILFRAVTHRHNVDVGEFGAAFAPIAMCENLVPSDFRSGAFLHSFRYTPVEQRVELRHSLPALAWLYVLEEGAESSDHLA